MSGRPCNTPRLPAHGPGVLPWAAILVHNGFMSSSHLSSNWLYYQCPTTTITTQALTWTLDLNNRIGTDWASLQAIGTLPWLGPVWMWDGLIIHAYTTVPMGVGLWPFTMSPAQLAVCCIKRALLPGGGQLNGHTFLSPFPKTFIDSDGWLTPLAQLEMHSICAHLFTTWTDSNGNTWKPALLHSTANVLTPITSFKVRPQLSPYRRRERTTAWVANVTLPTPTPTPGG